MNDQLQQAFISILSEVTTGTKNAITFLSGEIPDVINQLLLWKASQFGVGFLICVLMFSISLVCIVKCNKKDPEIEDIETFLAWSVGGITIILSFIIGIALLFDFLQVVIAPKIFLIEYAAELLKK